MISQIRDFIKSEAKKFGADIESEFNKPYIERNNTNIDALNDDGAYFGFIHPEEETSGPFHDFSLTIFPAINDKPWVVCLGIGSMGFKNDFELASVPGIRRIFYPILGENSFCKTNFTDIETGLPKSFTSKVPHLKNSLKTYTKVLPVCEIIEDPLKPRSLKKISAFVAGYAKLRDWPNNAAQRNEINTALSFFNDKNSLDEEEEAFKLLSERKFIILEGPPGTGKTRLAKILSKKIGAYHYLTQFHPEVSYSDFITGIRPELNSTNLSYKKNNGVFIRALEAAKPGQQNVVLIIDEINRANLSNVLGPLFYLIEYRRKNDGFFFRLPDGEVFDSLPENLYIIGTMNTADRSLAVVDFALRRRFAWFALKPRSIESFDFHKKEFDRFDEIFKWYADSSELNFQPGQAYFFASNEKEMNRRIEFELFPLIKEYLAEGIMIKAKEEFNSYFKEKIQKSLFE
jgi:hypothetical protein